MTTKIFDAQTLEIFAKDLLAADGFTETEADITAKSLILSNLYGHDSHGIIRVPQYIDMRQRNVVKSGAELIFEKDDDNSCLVDADIGLGQVQMPLIIDHLLKKAKDNSVVCGAIRNIGHTGRLGEWSEYIAMRGYAGIVLNNDNGTVIAVAPPGSKEPRTSSNPIALGIPLSDDEVFSLDMSTSAIALGKITVAKAGNKQLPPNTIQDANGVITTEPDDYFNNGAALPMGGDQGYKGFGLAMFVDFLTAGLTGGLTPPAETTAGESVSNVVMTIWNPEKFSGLNHMQDQANKFIDFIREAEPIDTQKPIRIAGDRSKICYKDRLTNGIPLSQGTIDKLNKAASACNIDCLS